MNNDQEPRGDEDEERPADSPIPRDTQRDTPRDSSRDTGAVSSDSGWRQVLSGLGVDVEHDLPWQSGRRAGEGKPTREGARQNKNDDASDGAQGDGVKNAASENARADNDGSEDAAGDDAASEDGLGDDGAGSNKRGASARGEGEEGGEMEERAQWVGESEVSIERLYQLFDSAYMECDLDEDGDLRVVTDSGPRIFLSMHEPNRLIRYMAFYKFREEAIEYDKLLFVNALNDDIVFIRFSLNGVDTLIADYYLPYARGASPFHIINAAKLMGRVITSGIRQHDTNNLLE